MQFIKTATIFFLSFLLFSRCSTSPSDADSTAEKNTNVDTEEWIQLFNNKDLNNWTPKFSKEEAGVNYANIFLVEDSLLKVRYPDTMSFKGGFKFGHLFYNQEKFSHYRIRAKYRFIGEQIKDGPAWAVRNNGLMLHCQSPESMALDQDFPNSLELQLLGGNGEEDRSNANLCTPGTLIHLADTLNTKHCIKSGSKTYHGDQWVEVEALVLGDSLFQHILEDEVVFTYTNTTLESDDDPAKEGLPLKEGFISIQAETHPIDFEKIEVLNLCGCMDKKAKNYKSYYVKADNSKCFY